MWHRLLRISAVLALLGNCEAQFATQRQVITSTGPSMALDGDTLLFSRGDYYVYVDDGVTWNEAQVIDPGYDELFYPGFALQGNRAVIAADGDPGAAVDVPHVFVYERGVGGSWTRVLDTTIGSLAFSGFGAKVDLDGDRIVAGSYYFTGSAPTVELELVNSVWTATTDGGDRASGYNGISIDGDRYVEGDRLNSTLAPAGGAAWVYSRTGSAWALETLLFPSSPGPSLGFGHSVGIDGDRIAVGTRSYSPTFGSVTLFERIGNVWQETDVLSPVGLSAGSRFGEALVLDGDLLLVGAPGTDLAGTDTGSVYAYRNIQGVWVEVDQIQANPAITGALFGIALAYSDGVLAVNTSSALFGFDSTPDRSLYLFDLDLNNLALFCAGNAPNGPGSCSSCPCGNDAVGVFGGCLNSAGQSAFLQAFGAPSLSAETLRFELRSGSPSAFGLLVSGAAQLPLSGPCPPGTGAVSVAFDGLRCIGVDFQRHGARSLDGNGDSNVPWQNVLTQSAFAAGVTRYYQVLYRDDPLAVCQTGIGTSNGVEVQVVP